MIDTIYLEESVRDHPLTRDLLRRYAHAVQVPCASYGEVFNHRAQNFRLQKRRPALILARKERNFVHAAPPGYGIGGARNFYFSHLLNCPYDCRYCFLQGMFGSANYVLFVNYEEFGDAMAREIGAAPAGEETWFFSGYDADSLALEPVTRFAVWALDWLAGQPRARLELRTKSTHTRALLKRPALPNCVVAFSLAPEPLARRLEHQAPTVAKRLAAAARLQRAGWPVGIRLDPLIYVPDYARQYRALLDQVAASLASESLHSVSVGGMRLPRGYFERMARLYPDEPLFAGLLAERDGMVAYPARIEAQLIEEVSSMVRDRFGPERLFTCDWQAAA